MAEKTPSADLDTRLGAVVERVYNDAPSGELRGYLMEQLQAIHGDMNEALAAERDRLREQRGALLEALQHIRSVLNLRSGYDKDISEAHDTARDAIAAAREG